VDAFVLLRGLAFLGLLEAAGGMAGYVYAYFLSGWRPGQPLADAGPVYLHATTLTLACIVVGQVGVALTARTERSSVFSIGLFSNRLLLGGIAVQLALLSAIIYLPLLQQIFGAAPLTLQDWAFVAIWPLLLFCADELRKLLARRFTAPSAPSGRQIAPKTGAAERRW
jgi:magnesium-transporting ATPase (P-type)